MPDAHPSSLTGKDSLQEPRHTHDESVPLAIEQIDTMLRLLSAGREQIRTFLDLGSNEGMLSAAILSEHPAASGVAIESGLRPLETTRRQLHPHASRLHFSVADLGVPRWTAAIGDHVKFDAVVAAFAAQHLSADRKRELFQEIHRLLNPGGIFVLMEHVASATRWTEEVLDDYMIDAVFGAQLRKSGGKPRAQVAREFFAAGAGESREPAPLEVQCDWLKEAGFQSVDCYLKVSEMAVFGGQKPGLPNPTP